MKKVLCNLLKTTYFAACFLFLFSGRAYAYFDPSATTYVIQAIAAVGVALGAVVTVFRHKISALFKGNKTVERRDIHMKEETAQDEDDQ